QKAVRDELDVILFGEIPDVRHEGVGAAAAVLAVAAPAVALVQSGPVRGVAVGEALDLLRRHLVGRERRARAEPDCREQSDYQRWSHALPVSPFLLDVQLAMSPRRLLVRARSGRFSCTR